MKECQITYFSKPTDNYRFADMEEILTTSRRNNERLGVSGMLAMTHSHFMQVLEGPREAVSQTLGRIMRDERHSDVTLYGMTDIEERQFAGTPMAFVGAHAFTEEFNRSLFGMPNIIPSLLSYECVRALFKKLCDDAELTIVSEEKIREVRGEDFFEITI